MNRGAAKQFRTSSVTSEVEPAMFLGGKWINFSWEKPKLQDAEIADWPALHCTLWIIHSTPYIVHWIVYIVHRTLFNVQFTMSIIPWTLYTVESSLLTEHSAVFASVRGGRQKKIIGNVNGHIQHVLNTHCEHIFYVNVFLLLWKNLLTQFFQIWKGGTCVLGKHS